MSSPNSNPRRSVPEVNADRVILVDEHDSQIGTEAKMRAHYDGLLHRAFSIFIFNSAGKVMLQQRAVSKYHSGGLWTNTCCSHPRPDETVSTAAHRRLREEMGFECELKHEFAFTYRAQVGEGLIENEFDHVFTGLFDGRPILNTHEAESWRWDDPIELDADLKIRPELYTVWFRIAWERLRSSTFSIRKLPIK